MFTRGQAKAALMNETVESDVQSDDYDDDDEISVYENVLFINAEEYEHLMSIKVPDIMFEKPTYTIDQLNQTPLLSYSSIKLKGVIERVNITYFYPPTGKYRKMFIMKSETNNVSMMLVAWDGAALELESQKPKFNDTFLINGVYLKPDNSEYNHGEINYVGHLNRDVDDYNDDSSKTKIFEKESAEWSKISELKFQKLSKPPKEDGFINVAGRVIEIEQNDKLFYNVKVGNKLGSMKVRFWLKEQSTDEEKTRIRMSRDTKEDFELLKLGMIVKLIAVYYKKSDKVAVFMPSSRVISLDQSLIDSMIDLF